MLCPGKGTLKFHHQENFYFSLRNFCEVKHGHVCKALVTNPSHWLYVYYIIHLHPIATDTGCH